MNRVRAILKNLLFNTFLYETGKRIYARYKLVSDKIIFQRKYPKAKYIHYSQQEIQRQREQGYYSQYGQDYFLWHAYFSAIDVGKFVDIGANQPTANSNSLFLEKNSWEGLAIDPLKHFGPLWLKHRETPLVCGAVADYSGEEKFIEILPNMGWEHSLSGFKKYVRDEDLRIYQYKEYSVSVKPLSYYLSASDKVDLVMIDVEGAEMQVLKGIDFSDIIPTYLLVENNSIIGGSETIRDYLKTKGYECVARIAATDDFFIKY